MMTDKDLTDDVLDEIIASAKTSMEQYLALSLKAEREENRTVGDEHVRYESNAGGNLWIQCSKQAYDRRKAQGYEVRELYERPHPGNSPSKCSLRNGIETIRSSGIPVDVDKIQSEIQAGNSPVIPDGLCPCCGRKPLKHSKCSVSGCGRKHVANGLCQRHYDMKRREDTEQVEKFREANRRFTAKKRAQKAAAPQQEVK